MPPNLKKPTINDDQVMQLGDPMDSPLWWQEHSHTPGLAPALLASKRAAAENAGVPSAVSSWATVDPAQLGEGMEPYAVSNIVNGQWTQTEQRMSIINPLDKSKQDIFSIPDTQVKELQPFIQSLRRVPKSGVHNPLKNNDRYIKFGEISRKVNRF